MIAVSQVPQQVAWTFLPSSSDRSSIRPRHSATRFEVAHPAEIGAQPIAAGKVALLMRAFLADEVEAPHQPAGRPRDVTGQDG